MSGKEAVPSTLTKHITLGPEVRFDGSRRIYLAQCNYCRKMFQNHRSCYAHLKEAHRIDVMQNSRIADYFAVSRREPTGRDISGNAENEGSIKQAVATLSENDKRIVQMIASCAIPLHTLEKEQWKSFLDYIGAKDKFPSVKKLRKMTIEYARQLKQMILSRMKGQNVSIITDGGSLYENQYYVIVYFVQQRLYFGGFKRVMFTDHVTLARMISSSMTEVTENGGIIVGCVTDNAKNLALATTSASQAYPKVNTDKQVTSIQEISGIPIIHISCGVHTVNLVLQDLEKVDEKYSKFRTDIMALFKFLREKTIRTKAKGIGITKKIPLIQAIKWMSFADAFEFLLENRGKVNELLQDPFVMSKKPPVEDIPDEWIAIMQVLRPFNEFLLQAQESSLLLPMFYDKLLKLMRHYDEETDPMAKCILRLLKERFKNTANGSLGLLSWAMTRYGHDYYQARLNPLRGAITCTQSDERVKLLNERTGLVTEMVKVHEFYGFRADFYVISAMFDFYLFEFNLVDGFDWKKLSIKSIEISGQMFSLEPFAICAERIMSLPASEAVAERVLSSVQNLFGPSRASSKDDLIESQIIIRMQKIFDGWNAQIAGKDH